LEEIDGFYNCLYASPAVHEDAAICCAKGLLFGG
jgi:hypothetical protein